MACVRKRRGKWVVDWRDGGGVRRWKTFDTRRAAEDFLDLERPKTRQWIQPAVDPGITLDKYAERWKAQITATVKPRTLEAYTQILDQHLLPVFGATKVQQLQRGQIKAFLVNRLMQGMARNTVRNFHACLRAMLRAAVDDGVLVANPADRLGRGLRLITSTRARQEEIKAMTAEQRTTFLTCAAAAPEKGKVDDRRFFPLFFLMAGTGLRHGETLAVQWQDLDLKTRSLRVERAFSRRKLQTPKAGHGRTVDLSRALCDVLARLEVDRKAEKLRRGWKDFPPWLFCTKEGTPFDEDNVRKAMARVLKRAQLPEHFTPHGLRHTYASLLLQLGVSIAYVQRQLGHASIQLTVDTYGKWLPLEHQGALDRLDPTSGGASGSKVVAAGGGESTQSVELARGIEPPTCGLQITFQRRQTPRQARQHRGWRGQVGPGEATCPQFRNPGATQNIASYCEGSLEMSRRARRGQMT